MMKFIILLIVERVKYLYLANLFLLLIIVPGVLCLSCAQKSNPVDSNVNQNSGQPARIVGSPYPVSQKPDTLFIVDESNFTSSQQLTINSLQGVLAQKKPLIYCVGSSSDSYSTWLNDLQKNYGVVVINSYRADFKGLLNHFKSYINGYILTDVTQPSVHVAISLAGLKNAIVVAGTDEQIAKDLGIPFIEDVTGETYQQFIDKYQNDVNKNILCYQAPEKANFLSDYSIFGKMYFFYDNTSSPVTSQVFSQMNPNSPLLGWGSSEFDLVRTASQHSIIVHAADYAKDLSVLSNFGVETKQASYITNPQVVQNVHTVCFLMTDGDNVQWLLNDFSTNTKWYGSPDRKKVNIGWTVSPAMCELAPTVLKKFYDGEGKTEGGRDYFVAGPSGLGYVYPDNYQDLNGYAELTNEFMKKADLHIVNLLGNSIDSKYLLPFLNQDQIDAIFYYYFSNYAGGNGQIYWLNGKPVITARYNLWSPQYETPESLAAKLNSLSTDITSQQSYSLIDVHVWSHSVDDIINCVSLLNKNVRVVPPDEFVALIKQNIKH
ncbi:MAG: hypothetical protein M1480_04115 [Bacteroidetes bacterium]|nr:hypothetical protein [Bacteroidota bacterium]